MFSFVDVQKVLLEKLMGINFGGKASDLIKSMLINTECVKLDSEKLIRMWRETRLQVHPHVIQ